jgi:outer membrane biosynthesis protein TonB
LAVTLGISLGAHVLIAGAMFHHRVAPVPAPDPVDPAPALAGETFELPAPDSVVAPLQNASPSPEVDGVESPSADGDAPAKPTPKQPKGKAAKLASKAGRPSGGHTASADGEAGGTGAPALYGAVGDRSAADVATAFVRGFPQAASADPAWKSAAMGSAGDVDLILTIDESGHFVSHQVVGSPSPALASGISRTIALIKGRAFTAKGKTTKLHLSATVASDQVHDGLHGDVFAIGGSYVGTEGNAFFALNIGRRIDVHVRAR